MAISAVDSRSQILDALATEGRVALIGIHAMRYPPGCVLAPAEFEQLVWYSHILPDGMDDVADCLRARTTTYGETLHTVACGFKAFDFNALGQSKAETPGGIAWDAENVSAWTSFFSFLLKIAELSESHFPVSSHVFTPGERVPIFHAHFVTLWRYSLSPNSDGRLQETDYQLLGELDLYSPLLPRAVKGQPAPATVAPRENVYGQHTKHHTVRVKDDAPGAARKPNAGIISLSPTLRKLTTRAHLPRSGPSLHPG